MNSVVKASVWLVIALLVGGQFSDLLQSSMVDAGLLKKPISISDACKLEILPSWFEDALGCKKENKIATKKETLKPKLSLGGDLLQKFKFETREKTISEKLTEKINKAFAFAQRLVLPEKYVLPCLLGDCDMDKKIQKEKEMYTNLLHKKVPLTPPEKGSAKKMPDLPKTAPNIPSPDTPKSKSKSET